MITKSSRGEKKSTFLHANWELFLKIEPAWWVQVVGIFSCLCWELLAIQGVIAFEVSP